MRLRAGLAAEFDGGRVEGAGYAQAAAAADIVVLTVPFQYQAAIVTAIRPALRGQILLDTTVPPMPGEPAVVQLPPAGSAAVLLQQRLGTGARVVSAFHNIPTKTLRKREDFTCDVLVFGDAEEVRLSAIRLVDGAGMRGIHGGVLANSAAAEAMASVLINVNKAYDLLNSYLMIERTNLD